MKGHEFGMFLWHKASETGVAVISVNEAYTTKSVSRTGELLGDIGGAAVVVGRDGE